MFKKLGWLVVWIMLAVILLWITDSGVGRLVICFLLSGLVIHALRTWKVVRRQE